jgi:hypothetical protein
VVHRVKMLFVALSVGRLLEPSLWGTLIGLVTHWLNPVTILKSMLLAKHHGRRGHPACFFGLQEMPVPSRVARSYIQARGRPRPVHHANRSSLRPRMSA